MIERFEEKIHIQKGVHQTMIVHEHRKNPPGKLFVTFLYNFNLYGYE